MYSETTLCVYPPNPFLFNSFLRRLLIFLIFRSSSVSFFERSCLIVSSSKLCPLWFLSLPLKKRLLFVNPNVWLDPLICSYLNRRPLIFALLSTKSLIARICSGTFEAEFTGSTPKAPLWSTEPPAGTLRETLFLFLFHHLFCTPFLFHLFRIRTPKASEMMTVTKMPRLKIMVEIRRHCFTPNFFSYEW